MDLNDVITLYQPTYRQDLYGTEVEVTPPTLESMTQVFCRVYSITGTEFYNSAQAGLKPEFKFVVFFGDYNNQPIIIYNDVQYSIIRTYRNKNDEIELYCERKSGV